MYDLAQLKHELIEALDNHPDPNAATVERQNQILSIVKRQAKYGNVMRLLHRLS